MITVVGSYVTDLMSRASRMPEKGETVLGGPFKMGPGGKGGNQAVAASRLGANVSVITRVGNDSFGQDALQNFHQENINTEYIYIDEKEATGVALIVVDDTSENIIVVALGACGKLNKDNIINAEKLIANSKVVLTQLETNIEAVITTINIANEHHVPVILNPAPYQDFKKDILKKVDYITPNETEASLLSGIKIIDDESTLQAAKVIYQMGVNTVIITLGDKGCFVYSGEDKGSFIGSIKVDAIDSTGAGDAFNGGFAYAISKNYNLKKAINFANATAALSVTKVGTAPSMPYLQDVEKLIQKTKNKYSQN